MQGEGRQCSWCGLLQCVEPEPRNAFAGQLLEVLAEHLHRRGSRLELHIENTVTAATTAVHGEVGARAQRVGAALLVGLRRRCLHRVEPARLLKQNAHEHTRFLLAHPPDPRPVVGEDQLRRPRLVPVGEPKPFAERDAEITDDIHWGHTVHQAPSPSRTVRTPNVDSYIVGASV